MTVYLGIESLVCSCRDQSCRDDLFVSVHAAAVSSEREEREGGVGGE